MSSATAPWVDLHNHLLPRVDDGARTADEARLGLQRMAEQGVGSLVVTPHLRASVTRRPTELQAALATFDRAFSTLQSLASEASALDLGRAVELMLDVPDPDLTDPRLRIAGTRYCLVEFPGFYVPPQSAVALQGLVQEGWIPIVAHPERYQNLEGGLNPVREWREVGAALQINAGSLVGAYGKDAQRHAWALLEQGLADLIASDFHSRGVPLLSGATEALHARGAGDQIQTLLERNPSRILRGLPVEPVRPIESPTPRWRAVLGSIRKRLPGLRP